jgi:hypothetical protein
MSFATFLQVVVDERHLVLIVIGIQTKELGAMINAKGEKLEWCRIVGCSMLYCDGRGVDLLEVCFWAISSRVTLIGTRTFVETLRRTHAYHTKRIVPIKSYNKLKKLWHQCQVENLNPDEQVLPEVTLPAETIPIVSFLFTQLTILLAENKDTLS